MALARSAAERRTAIESLFRVRAVETALDEAGEKSVWHQGNKGADLLSIVNRTGHVIRQELTLFEDYFLWTKQHGLRTGEAAGGPGSRANKASDDIAFDRENRLERMERAFEALEGYSGNDKYLLHVRALIKLAIDGHEDSNLDAVTTAQPAGGAAAEDRKTPARGARNIWTFVAAGFGAGLIIVLAAWLLVR